MKKYTLRKKNGLMMGKMDIYGICSDCLADRKEHLTLDLAKPGDRLIIKGYAGGIKFKMRLINMGLRVGDTIEMITNSGRDPVVIAVQSSRYILGRGMAHKVLVEQVTS